MWSLALPCKFNKIMLKLNPVKSEQPQYLPWIGSVDPFGSASGKVLAVSKYDGGSSLTLPQFTKRKSRTFLILFTSIIFNFCDVCVIITASVPRN